MTTQPTKEFLEQQVIARKIERWDIHKCSLCGYQCGYMFDVESTRQKTVVYVWYDKGCDCVTFQDFIECSMDNVLNHIAIQTSPATKQEHAAFWGY